MIVGGTIVYLYQDPDQLNLVINLINNVKQYLHSQVSQITPE